MTAYALSLFLFLTHGRQGPYTREVAHAIGTTAHTQRDVRALVAVAWIECRLAQWCGRRWSPWGLTSRRGSGDLPLVDSARIALGSLHADTCETAFGMAFRFNSGDFMCRWRRCPREHRARLRCLRARPYAVRVVRLMRQLRNH